MTYFRLGELMFNTVGCCVFHARLELERLVQDDKDFY